MSDAMKAMEQWSRLLHTDPEWAKLQRDYVALTHQAGEAAFSYAAYFRVDSDQNSECLALIRELHAKSDLLSQAMGVRAQEIWLREKRAKQT